tara:strand:+ start:1387 stop:2502 length:1116 start_codon:yes stop_codon:yes gene_type:complete
MKFQISKFKIFKCLSHLQGIVDKKNTLPILSNILIEAKNNSLILSSTDMDISIVEKLDCNILEDGSTTINSQMFYDIVRKLDENCEIEVISNNGKILTLRANGSRFSLSCLPKEDFPIIDQQNNGLRIKVNSKVLFKLIDKTRFAISNEETRYFLNGLYFNVFEQNNKTNLTLVGTDGHRLAKFSHEIEQKIDNVTGVIIPKKTINELSKLLSDMDEDIEIIVSSNKIIFFISNLVFISKLIDGTFPDYKRVIPKDNYNIVEINRSSLLSAVDRVSTIANDKSPVIKFKLLKNIINLNTINNDNSTATEDLNLNYKGDEIEIGFNSKYIMDIVNNLEDETITLNLKDGSAPITAQEKSNPNLIYVLMPMRV